MSLFVAPAVKREAPQYLRYENVSNCCGAGWMAYFPEPLKHDQHDYKTGAVTQKAGYLNPMYITAVKEDLDIICKKAYSLTLVILTDKQKEHYEKFVLGKGFKPLIKDVYHTYAGNLLTLYGKPRYKKKKDGTYIDTLTGTKGSPEDFSEENVDDYPDNYDE